MKREEGPQECCPGAREGKHHWWSGCRNGDPMADMRHMLEQIKAARREDKK